MLEKPFSSVQFSRSVMSDSLRLHESQHARPPCPSPAPGGGLTNSYEKKTGQFCSVQVSRSAVSDSLRPHDRTRQASLSITNSRSSLRLTSIESVMPSTHLILCCPLLLLPPIPPSIRVFSNESNGCGGSQIGFGFREYSV